MKTGTKKKWGGMEEEAVVFNICNFGFNDYTCL